MQPPDRTDRLVQMARIAARMCRASAALIRRTDGKTFWSDAGWKAQEAAILKQFRNEGSETLWEKTRAAGALDRKDIPFQFCVGLTLLAPDDQCVGRLYVLDTGVRELSAEERAGLKEIGGLISEELQRRQVLPKRKGHYWLEKAVEQAAEGIVVIDEKGQVEFANRAWVHMHGYDSAEELIGQSIEAFFREEAPQEDQPLYQRAQKEGAYEEVMRHVRRNGTTFPAYLTVTPLLDDERRTVAFVGTANDITKQKQHEQKLIEAKEKVEETSQIKSAFLATISHEVRTPLAGIIGIAEVLSEKVTEEWKEYSRLIEQSGRRLLETMSAILEWAQLEDGSLQIHPSSFDIVERIEKIVRFYRVQTDEQDLSLHFDSASRSVPVTLDRSAVDRILSNLISNAVKFTEAGSITVAVEPEDKHVLIRVSDTGIGISEEFLPHLFEDFRQESTGNNRKHRGSGLGMAITKRLVKMLRGTIEVDSKTGQGSTFTVRLPRTLDDAD